MSAFSLTPTNFSEKELQNLFDKITIPPQKIISKEVILQFLQKHENSQKEISINNTNPDDSLVLLSKKSLEENQESIKKGIFENHLEENLKIYFEKVISSKLDINVEDFSVQIYNNLKEMIPLNDIKYN